MTDGAQSGLKCAACGIAGRAPTIEVAPGEQRPPLRPSFSFYPDGRVALICDSCRGGEVYALRTTHHLPNQETRNDESV
jgi:hypothetical protein